MKRASAIIATLLLCLTARGQGGLDGVIALIESGQRIACSYSYTLRGDVPVKGGGTAVICGKCYHISEGGLENWCDGRTLWTVDSGEKEVIVSEGGNSVLANPRACKDLVRSCSFDGKNLSCTLDAQGSTLELRAGGIAAKPADEGESFAFDTASLGKDWIITDLR